jgi:ribosomal-protein-alanine N-acetyltransferase
MGSSAKGYVCQVVLAENQIVGFAVLSAGADEAHLLNIAIDPEYQSLGLGRRWLGWVIRWAVAQNAHAMFLEVRSGNLVALSLYESAGFNRIGLRRDYYPSLLGREDAVVMGLDLSGLDIQEVTDSTEV